MSARFSKILSALPASTPFVGPETLERTRGSPYEVRLGANESAFGLSPKAMAVLRSEADRASWYCDPEHFDLRELLAAEFSIARENIVVGEGIDGLLGLTVRAYCDPGDAVVTSLGAYPTFNYHVAGFGARLLTTPYRPDCHNDTAALVDLARRENAKLLYLANPDNPTGTFLGRSAVEEILEALPQHCLLLLDEAYYEFAPDQDLLPVTAEDPRLIRFRTFSKAHGMAGLRIGYAIASRDTIAAFDKIRLHFGVGRLSQLAAVASLGDRAFVATVIADVAKGRDDYEALARDLNIPSIPSFTNFVALDVGSEDRSQQMVHKLHEMGVFVRRPGVPILGRFVRLTVGKTPERVALKERFADAFRSLI